MSPPPGPIEAFHVPLPPGGAKRKLTPAQWRRIEAHLDEWKQTVLAAARRHPAKSYRLGHAQVSAFAELLGNLNTSLPGLSNFGGTSPSMREAEQWAKTYTLRELDDALSVYIGRIKDALLYGLRGAINPTAVASLLYKATHDARINWRMIARTEMARANAQGRLAAIEAMGYEQVWCPPHMGSCKACKRLLENKVFDLDEVRDVTNFGRIAEEWVACCPLHPHCRHGWLPYEAEVYEAMQEQYRALEDAGLDEDTLDAMFGSDGQLLPEHAGDPRLATLKTYGWHAELLAIAVAKTTFGGQTTTKTTTKTTEWLDAGELRTDLYQRAMNPEKVLAMHRSLRAGEQLPAPEVRMRPDGTAWVVDGQHRVQARKLNGEPLIECLVRPSGGWEAEADECREAIAKILDPTIDPDAVMPYMRGGAELRKMPTTLNAAVLVDAPESYTAEPAVEIDSPPLDGLLFDGLRLRDDVAMALEQWWELVAGPAWASWSTLHMPAYGARPHITVDYAGLRSARPELAKLADVDLHLALVAATLHATRARELAPGLALEPLILPAHEHEPDALSWDLAEQAWVGGTPPGLPDDLAKALPAYTWTATAVGSLANKPTFAPLELALADRLVDEPYVRNFEVAKLAVKQGQVANAGVEHWITIHPHGDEEKGQPVLVRNGADGSMTVIGGAGGNLNMMRLDPSRRVDRDEGTGKPKGATGGSKVEQPVTEAEAEARQHEREQQITAARESLAKVQSARQDRQAELHDYLREHLGVDLDDPELDHRARQKVMKKLRVSALRTLAYGPIQRRDVAEGATAAELRLDSRDAPKPWLADDDTVENDSQEGQAETGRKPRPSVAMGEDHARSVLDALLDLRELQSAGGRHRRVIAGEERGANAMQIDWSEGTMPDGQRDERRARAVEQQLRTDLSRELAEHGDKQLKGKAYDRHFRAAHAQGGFDSIDAFTHAILGESVLSKEAYDLLGVAGAAQLVGHTIQQRAAELGKKGLDLTKVQGALKQLTDEQEAAVNERGLARMKRALTRAAQAHSELSATERGEASLFTTTMARSIGAEKVQEAKRGLGMMVGGLEATSALKTALDRKAGEKVKVGGYSSPATIKEAAAKARIKIADGDIVKVGAGNYTLAIAPEKLAGLVRPEGRGDPALRKRLEQIRTGEGLDAEIKAARSGPGMSDVLDANQAKGKLFLQATGSCVLGFDPGVGKTHTAIAAAMEKMAAEPGKHRALIVCPGNVMRSWATTIRGQGSNHTCTLVGEHREDPSRDTRSTKVKHEQLTDDADFTIVSYDTLKGPSGRALLRQLHAEGRSHSVVIADELQMGKNEDSQRHQGVEQAVDHARDVHGDDASFWGLTGTPIEKDTGDLHAMQKLVKRAKGQSFSDRKSFRAKFKRTGQDEHIARGDKVREFRKGLDEDLFRLSAADAGNDLGEPGRTRHQVTLDPEHRQAIADRVKALNDQIADYHRKKAEGAEGGTMPEFGGRRALLDALYNHPDSALVRKAADIVDGLGSFDFAGMAKPDGPAEYAKGDHAGTYEHKSVVFGALENSRALFGVHPNGEGFDPEGRGGLAGELRKRGVKVFVGHGQMGGDAKNEASYKAFLAHPGKAVFVTNDKNNAGISLQFGDNKGRFQHGATHMIHFTRPVNNATIQQREARILRKGSQASFRHGAKKVGAAYHVISADTPVEQRLEETLEREARTQDLAANSEQRVAGADTLAHHLKARGVAVPG